MHDSHISGRIKNWGAGGAILLSFVVAAEVVIMISPFAFFFYAVFNPFLLTLNHSSITRWLTAFFLPHMIVPPNGVLVAIRIFGSVLLVVGLLIFLFCAGQVYLGKLLNRGTATTGLYLLVRHPQYVGLSLAAIGLAIMWPRFLTLVLLVVMFFMYYILARDEEHRMTNRFGENYTDYMKRTGMFVPRAVEDIFAKNAHPGRRPGAMKATLSFLILFAVIVGSGFILRDYTVHHLPLERVNNVDVITITRGDLPAAGRLLPVVLKDSTVESNLRSVPAEGHNRILAYFIPIDYIMQGMIANTGKRWKLFERHKTIGMISDYIFHPVAHLLGKHTHEFIGMHSPIYANAAMKRRIIFIDISSKERGLNSSYDDFNVNDKRIPLFFVDVNLHTGRIMQVKDVPRGSGWGTVPTPMF